MVKVQVHEHTTSYQAITTKSPHGFQCLKKLFLEYDNPTPSRASLENLFARDFTDNENESERSIGREETIQAILKAREKWPRHQTDLKRALCIEHDHKRQEVLFEGVRFMSLPAEVDKEVELPVVEDKGEWIRVPFSGRIEVRVKENKFTLKEAVIEVVGRRWTVDHSHMVKRGMMLRANSTSAMLGPVSPESRSPVTSLQAVPSVSQVALPGGVSELPAPATAVVLDNKSLPSYHEGATPTVTSGSSVDGDRYVKS